MQLICCIFKLQMSGKGKVLTPELIFSKVKSDNLQSIKNLNLWGNELQDLQLIERMPSLEVISLSVNRIATLRDFSKCLKLQVLILSHSNYIYAKTASKISRKLGICSNYPPSRCYGCTTTPAPTSPTIEKQSSTTSPTQ